MKRRQSDAWERTQADLFFADLMGAPALRNRSTSRAHRDSERFFAELAGEAVIDVSPVVVRPAVALRRAPRLSPSVEYAEQPAPAGAALPAPIPPTWIGVDRKNIPKRTVGGALVADAPWMGTLIDNSNLRFTGAYVTGPALPGYPPNRFTPESQATSRGWIANIQPLVDQGWGVAFFYFGFSFNKPRIGPPGTNRAWGTDHGRHLRTTLNALGPAFAGAAVMIDNEDDATTSLPAHIIEYYLGIFEEMSRPDPDLGAFRPGLYGRGVAMEQMLAQRRDLFVWDVSVASAGPTPPFVPSVDPITVNPANRQIKAYQATAPGQGTFITWSLGRQFWFFKGNLPTAGSAVATRLPTWRMEFDWDFDVSFVRNPAFPVAEPRIAARVHAGAPVAVADFFRTRGTGATPTAPAAAATTQGPTQSTVFALAAGIALEPDAPLTLFPRGPDMMLATVLTGGDLGIATRSAGGTWTAIDRMGGAVPALRRLRALKGVANTASHSHVFFVGTDHRLYVKRLVSGRGWSDGQAVNNDLRLHPFSDLAGEARGAEWIETYFIDDRGLLTTAFWGRTFTTAPFPGFHAQRLETTPSLLPGSALSAICPQFDHVLVFGIGAGQRVHLTFFIQGHGWSPVGPIGGAQDLVGAHTRLAAHAIGPTEVELAALTDSGQLALYSVRLTGATWASPARQVIADPPPSAGAIAPPPARALLQPANGFRINPFGDLGIVRQTGQASSDVFCAGMRNGQAKTLKWNASGADVWQWFI